MAEASNDIASLFRSALGEFNTGQPLGLAVSGGGDSVALLHLAFDWAAERDIVLRVATVDHRLRPESRNEAAFVQAICTDLGVSHATLTLSGLQDGSGNLSARARNARYDALSGWACDSGVDEVLLGHTMDDQAETVLMRLARGSGAEGLSGMSTSMIWGGVQFRRPLLSLKRQQLRDWLVQNGREWIEDPTNDDLTYDRVKARAALTKLAPMGITIDGLSNTADRLARQREVLEAATKDLEKQVVSASSDGLILNRARLRSALSDTAMRVLANAILRVGGGYYKPRTRSLKPLYDRILSSEETTITLGHCLLVLNPEDVCIKPEGQHSTVNRSRYVP